jgi:hypothetical protein
MTSPIEVFRELLWRYNPAIFDCRNDGHNARKYYERGETPPEHLLPGRVVMELTPEQREILSRLTSEEVSKERLY